MTWAVAEAKAKFSEMLDKAGTSGPQEITKNGKPVAVLIGFEEYKKSRLSKPKESLVQYFRKSPAYGIDFDVERVPMKPRKVEF